MVSITGTCNASLSAMAERGGRLTEGGAAGDSSAATVISI